MSDLPFTPAEIEKLLNDKALLHQEIARLESALASSRQETEEAVAGIRMFFDAAITVGGNPIKVERLIATLQAIVDKHHAS